MPLRTETYEFTAEAERLEARLDEIADEVVDLDDGNPAKERLLSEGGQLDVQLSGVRWAMDAHDDEAVPVWDEDVDSVTLAGLTGGEYGYVKKRLEEEDEQNSAGSMLYMVAKGTEDGPYLQDSEKLTVSAVGDLPLAYLKWAQARIDDLTSVGDEGNGSDFGSLLKASDSRQHRPTVDLPVCAGLLLASRGRPASP